MKYDLEEENNRFWDTYYKAGEELNIKKATEFTKIKAIDFFTEILNLVHNNSYGLSEKDLSEIHGIPERFISELKELALKIKENMDFIGLGESMVITCVKTREEAVKIRAIDFFTEILTLMKVHHCFFLCDSPLAEIHGITERFIEDIKFIAVRIKKDLTSS